MRNSARGAFSRCQKRWAKRCRPSRKILLRSKVLGGALKQEFITYKRAEWEEYHQTVSQWEIDKYARLY